MQGEDIQLIKEAKAKAKAALAGKDLGFGMPSAAQPALKKQNSVPAAVPATTTTATTTATTTTTTTATTTTILPALRKLTEAEIMNVETHLSAGHYDLAMTYLYQLNDVSLNDQDVLSRFERAISQYEQYSFNEAIAWRVPISISNQSDRNNTYNANKFRRFLTQEHAKRTGAESTAQAVVRLFENANIPSAYGTFLKELVGLVKARLFNSAIQLLHANDAKRYKISCEVQKLINFAIELAHQGLKEELEDRGYSFTVADERAKRDTVTYFNDDLAQFKQTWAKYISGEPLMKYQDTSKYRDWDYGSYT